MNLSTGKLMIRDDDALRNIFSSSRLVTVHAEGGMVDKAIGFSKECGNMLYLCHISQRSELDTIKENKDKKIFAEATPHHLFLSEQDDQDSFTKMKPSLKSVLDNEALFEAIHSGLIDTVGTDHAPHTVGEKLQEDYPFGVPGIETMLPLLLDAVNDNRLELAQVQRLCSENPAKIFNIRNKGAILPGYDADFTVVDMGLVQQVSEETLHSKCKWTPFEGRTLRGWPVMTIVGGNIVYDGQINDSIKGKEVEIR
jgi:dihydroorotase